MHQNIMAYGICCSTHFTIEMIREFVMSLQVIIHTKQNGAQMATFAATGTRADIDDMRCRAWERGCMSVIQDLPKGGWKGPREAFERRSSKFSKWPRIFRLLLHWV